MAQDRVAGRNPLIFVLLQGTEHLIKLVIPHAHAHPTAAVGEGIQRSNRFDSLIPVSSIDAPADERDMLRVHLGLVFKEGECVVDVVHLHLQGGVFVHTTDAAGGLETPVIKAHAHIAVLGHLTGEHRGIDLVYAGPAGVCDDAGALLPFFVVIGKVDGSYHTGPLAVENDFSLFHNMDILSKNNDFGQALHDVLLKYKYIVLQIRNKSTLFLKIKNICSFKQIKHVIFVPYDCKKD